MQNILTRLKQDSTWRGIITVAALVGLQFSPEQQEAIITAALSLLAAIEIFRNQK